MNDILIAKEIALKVSNLGGKVYYVGGCVRDMMLGIEPKDYDFVKELIRKDIFQNVYL